MSRNNRNPERERRGGSPKNDSSKKYISEERNYFFHANESRERHVGASLDRLSLTRERENDLYERQSI
jgi:hypothetical protein